MILINVLMTADEDNSDIVWQIKQKTQTNA